MIRYNDDNIYVGQIKQLLKSFNLPTCRVHKEGNIYYNGEFFIDKDEDYLCQFKDGIVNKIKPYKFNDEILNITKHLEIKTNYYDTYTHEYLGEFLRFIKDYKNIDLMSMYNCFSNNSPRSFSFEFQKEDSTYEISTDVSGRNLYMIPVRPNTTYTIAIEYPLQFTMFCSFYAFNSRLFTTEDFEVNSMRTCAGCRFNSPFTYTTPMLTTEKQQKMMHSMKLFIELPVDFANNIVILEGDYTKSSQLEIDSYTQKLGYNYIDFAKEEFKVKDNFWYFNDVNTNVSVQDYPEALTTFECNWNDDSKKYEIRFITSESTSPIIEMSVPRIILNNNDSYLSRHQLLEYSTSTKYLLADRLREYLTLNVITPDDEIINNIKKVQMCLVGTDSNFKFDAYGIWDESIREWIYRYISQHGEDSTNLTFRDIYRDVLCYVDKDIEDVLKTLKIDNSKALERIEELGGL